MMFCLIGAAISAAFIIREKLRFFVFQAFILSHFVIHLVCRRVAIGNARTGTRCTYLCSKLVIGYSC